MKPPVVNFVPFHPSRVGPLRTWRERDCAAVLTERKVIRLETAERKAKKENSAGASDARLLSNIKVQLDPEMQKLVLEALKKRR